MNTGKGEGIRSMSFTTVVVRKLMAVYVLASKTLSPFADIAFQPVGFERMFD